MNLGRSPCAHAAPRMWRPYVRIRSPRSAPSSRRPRGLLDREQGHLVALDRGGFVLGGHTFANPLGFALARAERRLVLPQRDDHDPAALPVGQEDRALHSLRLAGLGRQNPPLRLEPRLDRVGRASFIAGHSGIHVAAPPDDGLPASAYRSGRILVRPGVPASRTSWLQSILGGRDEQGRWAICTRRRALAAGIGREICKTVSGSPEPSWSRWSAATAASWSASSRRTSLAASSPNSTHVRAAADAA